MDTIDTELERFCTRLGVPAAAAVRTDNTGAMQSGVTGQCRRDRPGMVGLGAQWHIGSCLKPLTAALYASFVASGQTRWDSKLADLLPDLSDRMHAGWHDRTIDELLTCRAGVAANLSPWRMHAAWKDTRPLPLQRSDVTRAALDRQPGERGRFRYSNLSYVIAGAIIDRLSGSDYESALASRLLEPIGVSSLGFGAPPDICGHSAALRVGPIGMFRGQAVEPSHPRADNPRVLSAAGTAHVNIEDFARLVAVFLDGSTGPLDDTAVRRLLAPPDTSTQAMAMGWSQWHPPASTATNPVLLVQGSNTRWTAAAMMDANRQRAAVVACNDGRYLAGVASAHLLSSLLEATG